MRGKFQNSKFQAPNNRNEKLGNLGKRKSAHSERFAAFKQLEFVWSLGFGIWIFRASIFPRAGVSEKSALLDDLRDRLRHHLLPRGVAGGDSLEHVAREDAQIFGLEIIEIHEAAALSKIAVKLAQLR